MMWGAVFLIFISVFNDGFIFYVIEECIYVCRCRAWLHAMLDVEAVKIGSSVLRYVSDQIK